MAQSLEANSILERSIQQLVKFVFLSFILALALTRKPLLAWCWVGRIPVCMSWI